MKKPTISISTKTGDRGLSGLISGKRISKSSAVFEAIGTIDELNSWLGLLVAKLSPEFRDQKIFIQKVQETLFYVGAELAHSKKTGLAPTALRELESHAEKLQHDLSPQWHTKFLLPGGTELAAWCDIARTVCRRAERRVVQLGQEEKVSSTIKKYVNRLSDYLYLLRCYCNDVAEHQEQEFIATSTETSE